MGRLGLVSHAESSSSRLLSRERESCLAPRTPTTLWQISASSGSHRRALSFPPFVRHTHPLCRNIKEQSWKSFRRPLHLLLFQHRQVVERRSHFRMTRSQLLLADGKRTLIEGHGFVTFALHIKQVGQCGRPAHHNNIHTLILTYGTPRSFLEYPDSSPPKIDDKNNPRNS